MTDILLVNPKSIDVLPSYLPYGLLYIGAYLRQCQFSVKIYDANTFTQDFSDYLKKEKPEIIGISILSGPCLTDAIEKARITRRLLPQAKIVFGGIHATLFPRQILRKEFVDFVVMNEGEHPLAELSEFILKRKGNQEEIKNLGYKKAGKLLLNPLRNFVNLDDLPLPAWDLLPMEKYIHQKFYAKRVLTLHTSRGCPWNCSYCYNQAVNFRRWRGMSAEKIIEQIEYLQSQYHITGFQFYDDEFDADPKRVEKFCRLVLKRNLRIKWSHYSRINVADEKRLRLEKEAGCVFVEFGVESGSPRLLKLLNKQQTVNQVKKAFKICQKVGLQAGAMFMIGLPTETEEEMRQTQKLIASLAAFQTICTIYHPYPGSPLYNYCWRNKLCQPLPSLEEQGRYFDLRDTQVNVSQIKTEELQEAYNSFVFNNVRQELKFCLTTGNWSLVWSHIKARLGPKNFAIIISGMRNYYLQRIVR